MEEDIEILEELQKYCSLRSIDITESNSDKWAKFVVSIENLINRVKELEEAVDNFMQGKAYSTKQLEKLKKNFIPKSKIREKIEEYDKQRIKMEKDDNGVGFTLGNDWSDLKAKIQVLQDILEDK